jgi:hypothetical protein
MRAAFAGKSRLYSLDTEALPSTDETTGEGRVFIGLRSQFRIRLWVSDDKQNEKKIIIETIHATLARASLNVVTPAGEVSCVRVSAVGCYIHSHATVYFHYQFPPH